jgi:hypothetical protein
MAATGQQIDAPLKLLLRDLAASSDCALAQLPGGFVVGNRAAAAAQDEQQ